MTYNSSIRLLGLAAIVLLATLSVNTAHAGSCSGTVSGLSNTYNLKKGSGFLAIRSKPTASSKMIGQTFNGNTVEIDQRRGNWLYVYDDASQKVGWV
ncbi:MAG: SH3 domain-containing protein, partial [Pseudomonadota bacterium]